MKEEGIGAHYFSEPGSRLSPRMSLDGVCSPFCGRYAINILGGMFPSQTPATFPQSLPLSPSLCLLPSLYFLLFSLYFLSFCSPSPSLSLLLSPDPATKLAFTMGWGGVVTVGIGRAGEMLGVLWSQEANNDKDRTSDKVASLRQAAEAR